MFNIRDRLSHCRSIIRWPVSILFLIFTALTGLSWVRDDFLPSDWQAGLKMSHLLPSWPWYLWAILALVTVIVGLIEGSFRLFREKIGPIRLKNPIISNIILKSSVSNTEPLYIIFFARKHFRHLHVSLQYSSFVNGTQWSFPSTVPLYESDNVANGQRIDLKLITREDSTQYITGIHWGAPTGKGDPFAHIVFGGLFRGRIIFKGDGKNEEQHYYFFVVARRELDSNISIQVIPDEDIGFIAEWELRDT
jgi:hypothetical protein